MNIYLQGERKTIMENKSKQRQIRAFLIVNVLIGLSAIQCLVDMCYVIGHISNAEIAYADVIVTAATLLDTLFRVLLVAKAFALYRGKKADTLDAVNMCQSLAIAAAGLCIIDWVVDALADNYIDGASLATTVVTVIVIAAYYRVVNGLSHSTFWDGIRVNPRLEPYLSVGEVATELALDEESGRLRPLKPGEEATVMVLTTDEYLDQAPAYIIQQILHSLNDVRRSSCIQLGDIVFGNVFIRYGLWKPLVSYDKPFHDFSIRKELRIRGDIRHIARKP